MGLSCVLVRHPMPYGDLAVQAVQRFEALGDLDVHNVTIEEREEYEQHINNGVVVYAGVDYEAILRQAEQEADVVIWDGGNNDTPFFKPGACVHMGYWVLLGVRVYTMRAMIIAMCCSPILHTKQCFPLCTDLWLVVTDPLRAGHEERYYPGDVNFRAADIIVINKANTATPHAVQEVHAVAECVCVCV